MTFRAGDLLEVTIEANISAELRPRNGGRFVNARCVILDSGEHLIVLPTQRALVADDWLRALSSARIVFLWVSYVKHRVKGEKL